MTLELTATLMMVGLGINIFVMVFPFGRFGVSKRSVRVIKMVSAAFLLAMAIRLFVYASLASPP